jgi:hypothetical protein
MYVGLKNDTGKALTHQNNFGDKLSASRLKAYLADTQKREAELHASGSVGTKSRKAACKRTSV